VPSTNRTRTATREQGRQRADIAAAYIRAAELVFVEDDSEVNHSVIAGLAVLAGIAASDALCVRYSGNYPRGQDHNEAVAHLLATGTRDSRRWSQTLKRLLDLKDEAHYGFLSVSKTKARAALGHAKLLVAAAQESFA
jgi:hypothetical protein